MKKLKLYSCLLGLFGIVSYAASAQDAATNETTFATNVPPAASASPSENNLSRFDQYYREHEISFDAFAVGAVGQQTINHLNDLSSNRIRHDGRLGAGLGINAFFCRYVGVGAEADSENTTHAFVDNASGNVILRLPIAETGLAPYIFGGGGYQFDPVRQGFGQAGLGLEFRFLKCVGIFVDGRAVIPAHTDTYAVARGGLRINL